MDPSLGDVRATAPPGRPLLDAKGPRDAAAGSPARLKVIVVLACVLFLDAAGQASVGAVAVPIEAALHVGHPQIGWLVSAPAALAALMALPFGALVDRVRRVSLLAAALVAWSAAMVASGLAPSYPVLLLGRLVLGVVASAAWPAVASLTGDFFQPGERGRIFGCVLAGELLGVASGLLICANLAAGWSWRAGFLVLAAPGFVLAVVLWRYLPEPARGGQSHILSGARPVPPAGQAEAAADVAPHHGSLRRVIRWRGARPHHALMTMNPATAPLWRAVRYVLAVPTCRMLIVASSLGGFYAAGLRGYAIVFMRDRFGLGPAAAGSLAVLLVVGAIAGVLLAGRLGDRLHGRGRPGGRIWVAAGAYLLATAMFLPGLLIGMLWLAGPFFFVAAAGLGGAGPAGDAARLEVIPSALWGRAEGVRAAVRFALVAAVPPLFGHLSTRLAGHAGTRAVTGGDTALAQVDATGLDRSLLLMLAPLAAAGVLLLVRATGSYARDAASAMAAERRTRERSRRR
jgi:predicted MFS family arabinose efflux permease